MGLSTLVAELQPVYGWYAVAALISVIIGLVSSYNQFNHRVPEGTPEFVSGSWPLVGNFKFFSARWDFHNLSARQSKMGNWSFYVANMPVVGMSGRVGRKLFFDSKKLNMDTGYKALFAGSPDAPSNGEKSATDAEDSGPNYFTRRVIQVLKRDRLERIFPVIIDDLRQGLDGLAAEKNKTTNPFISIYDFLYIMIVRVVACNELATDHKARKKLLAHYEMIESAATPWVIMFPRLPTWGALKRLYGGIYVWTTFDKIMKERQKTGRREDDPLQILMDDNDNTTQIITFIIGALYTGQLNSGINASWIIVFLAQNPEWHKACWKEVNRAVDKHVPDISLSLVDRLTALPFTAWEEDFPIVDACLRETIRVTITGAMFRQNTTSEPIRINEKEVVPPGYYTSYAISDVHMDASLYPDPTKWDPHRYINLDGSPLVRPQGENNTTSNVYPFLGWGAGRHPCMGMKFAKLEMFLVVAFWLAYFDFEIIKPTDRLPKINLNAFGPERPKEEVLIKYWTRGQAKP